MPESELFFEGSDFLLPKVWKIIIKVLSLQPKYNCYEHNARHNKIMERLKIIISIMLLSISITATAQQTVVSYDNLLKLWKLENATDISRQVRQWGYALENTSKEEGGFTTYIKWTFKNKALDYSLDLTINKENIKVEYLNWYFYGNQAFANIREEILTNGWIFAGNEVDESGIKTIYKHENIKGILSLYENIPHKKYTIGFCAEEDTSEYFTEFEVIRVDPPLRPEPEPDYVDENKVYDVVEYQPQFAQGDVKVWLARNVKYPPVAAENGIEGKVLVQFVVGKDGSIYNASVVRGAEPSLDREALRVINSMPKWIPGKQNGVAVNCKYVLPVVFRLN